MQFYDRSPICTHALNRHLGHPPSPALDRELARIEAEAVYDRRVFFVLNLGFVTRTEARRIGYDEALAFERLHEQVYRDFGYTCVPIGPGTVDERADAVRRHAGLLAPDA